MKSPDANFHVLGGYRKHIVSDNPRDTSIQVVLSVALGVTTFIAFCILRVRWAALYAARKRQKAEASVLPDLPDSFFGWMPALWKITDQQVLASAGLDAYVFLAFFRMAIKFLLVTLFFAIAVIKPVHDQYPDEHKLLPDKPKNDSTIFAVGIGRNATLVPRLQPDISSQMHQDFQQDYLWMYLVFVYLFSGLAIYLIIAETRKVIEVRQDYLGSQSTVTDRTIRLSGIPMELRSEEKIKEFVEELEIGKVESVMLCRNWKELDQLMVMRAATLRKLEESLTVYLERRGVKRNSHALPVSRPSATRQGAAEDDDHENAPLMSDSERDATMPYAQYRPTTRIWFGRFHLQCKKVDAIDYYETSLKKIDEKIRELRNKTFEPTPLAFVTMDSVASCQMAVQAVLDPSPLQLLAKSSPAPTDVVWENTYLPRFERMVRAWSITIIVTVLTIFWSILLLPIVGALDLQTIRKVLPQLAEALEANPIAKSLVQTQLPTLLLSLLNVAVPYLYDWLANHQGMTSQGDVELSVISKNFFFTFFNFFITFTVLGTASKFYVFLQQFDNFKDPTKIANALAISLQKLLSFYVNYIILQGLGLFPLKLLEFGSVAMYPVGLIGSKTPRDYADLEQPPVFSYGFYLPQTILIFIICIVYSVLRSSWSVLLAGLAYFVIGRFVYKYQLLYAMDHKQHSTGRGWIMMCNRVLLGLAVFQLTVAGQLALQGAVKRSTIVFPLLCITMWFSIEYNRTYQPLMKFIALKSIRRAEHSEQATSEGAPDVGDLRYESETRHRRTVDESRESGLRFVNPSLVAPLEGVWLEDRRAD